MNSQFEQTKIFLNQRGAILLSKIMKYKQLETLVTQFVENNRGNVLTEYTLWVEPFLNNCNLFGTLAEREVRQFAATSNIDLEANQSWADQFCKNLTEQYEANAREYLPLYEEINSYLLGMERRQESRRREEYRNDERHRKERQREERAKKEDRLREQRQKEEMARKKKQEELKLKAEEEMRIREEEARRRPKVMPFSRMTSQEFDQMMARLGTGPELLSQGMQERVSLYQARGRKQTQVTQSLFESKYADRKVTKNNTNIIKAVKDSKPTKEEEIVRGKKTTKVQEVSGLMRAVEAPELTELKEKIRKENFVERSMELAVSSKDQFRREAKFNLNLLTPENFEQLVPVFAELAFKRGEECCGVLVEELVFKAWNEQKYCELYANLSKQLSKRKDKDNQFRVTLISEVESYFHSKDETLEKGRPDFEEQLRKLKLRKLGNVKFISELLKLKVLKQVVAQICFFKLLRNYVLEVGENPAAELNVEGMIVLLDRSGRFLEQSQKTVNELEPENKVLKKLASYTKKELDAATIAEVLEQSASSIKCSFNFFFKVFQLLERYQTLSYRLRALTKNLLQKKESGWVQVNKAAGPKKLSELGEEQEEVRDSSYFRKDVISSRLKEYFGLDMDYCDLYRKVIYLQDNCRLADLLEQVLVTLCDGRHDAVQRRKLLIADLVLDAKDGRNAFLTSWNNRYSELVSLSSDQLFLPAVLSHNFRELLKTRVLTLGDLRKEFGEDEEEERDFYNEVMTKLVALEGGLEAEVNRLLSGAGCEPVDLKSRTANKNVLK